MLNRLSEPETYMEAKHGYARGFETLQFVDNVRNFYDILARMEPRGGEQPEGSVAQLSTKGAAPGK